MDFIVSIKGKKHPMYIRTKSYKINKMFLQYAFSEERDIQKCRALNDSLLAILEHIKTMYTMITLILQCIIAL